MADDKSVVVKNVDGSKISKSVVKKRKSWKIVVQIIISLITGFAALVFALYPSASQWINHRAHVMALAELNDVTYIGPEEKLKKVFNDALDYNKRFLATGSTDGYRDQLNLLGNGMMGRILIPSITVDLPIYHFSTDAVLRNGAGHMPETTLPVGGLGSHAAITAHRGLAESVLFTNLDKVKIGDRFILEVSGEVLSYEVDDYRIVKPDETDWLQFDKDKDLVTLITCDPIGINSQRILVTGHRVPTIEEDLVNLEESPVLPFPWWIVWGVVGSIAVITIAWWAAKPPKSKKPNKDTKKQNKSVTSDFKNFNNNENNNNTDTINNKENKITTDTINNENNSNNKKVNPFIKLKQEGKK